MPVYITAVILQEVLQGVREDIEYEKVREVLLDLVKAAIGAATLYRMLRKKGVTIRKPNDCLIAQYAIFYDIPALHSDVDFDQIARYSPLRLVAL
jgi:predicted nucleic acid-binding protein